MQKFHAPIQPKIPDGTQKSGKQHEKHHAAPGGPQQDEPPELSVCLPQHEQGQRAASRQAVQQIQHPCEAGEPQTHRPQQIVHNAGGQTQQNGKTEGAELIRDLKGHRRLPE